MNAEYQQGCHYSTKCESFAYFLAKTIFEENCTTIIESVATLVYVLFVMSNEPNSHAHKIGQEVCYVKICLLYLIQTNHMQIETQLD